MFDFEIYNSENAKQFGKKEYATVKIDQKHFRINDLGNIVLDLDEVVFNISDCCPSIPHKLNIVRFRNRFGVKDVNDEWVVKPKYDQIEYLFYLDEYEDHFLVTRKNKMGVVDKIGHVIIPIKYKSLRNMTTSVNPSDGILFKGVLQDKEVIIDLCNNQYNLL
ncbi:WG repeat-containing protein [Flavobacteriaceae bacterium M23B6Z8]